MITLDRRRFVAATIMLAAGSARASTGAHRSFADIAQAARGQTVFFNAWGGDERTNSFIAWVGQLAQARHGVTLTHVKLRDTADAISRILAEHQAGRTQGGSVDLIWINGPNLLTLKQRGLLHGPFVETLPHWPLVDTVNRRSNLIDFTLPVDGYAAPWQSAQVVFVHDEARTPRLSLPGSMAAMVPWARANPGRLAHPNGRNFLGATFLKQALIELVADRRQLEAAVDQSGFDRASVALWEWYRALRPHLWRAGRDFPETGPAALQLLNDGEIDLTLSFSPAEAAISAAARRLPPTARAYVLDGGTLANTSFVAIPANAAHREGAMVIANLLLDPLVQAHAQDPRHLGAVSVLDIQRLPSADRARFEILARDPAMPSPAELARTLPEPHPSWMSLISARWERLTLE